MTFLIIAHDKYSYLLTDHVLVDTYIWQFHGITYKRHSGNFLVHSIYFVSGKAHSNNKKEIRKTKKHERNTQTHIKRRKHIHILRIKASTKTHLE